MKGIFVAVLTAAMAIIAVEAGSQGEVECAREILETSAKTYRGVDALRDTLSYVVTAPGSEQETKTQVRIWSRPSRVREERSAGSGRAG